MTNEPSTSGRQLLALLPEVYRTRDRDQGHLAAYLDACGELLDLIRNTLDQRLADAFPDAPPQGLAAQDWLLPYFAQLVDARLVSPHVEGRRAEVGRAVAWRQRKGTVGVAEQIAEAVAQLDAEVHEGWKRVATTPRVGLPSSPATVDVRYPSRAVATDPDGWRQLHPSAAPCFPGSYEDASRRTVDLRTPSFKAGHVHPRRLALFVPPPTGFFPPEQVRLTWAERAEPYVCEEDPEAGVHHILNSSQVAVTVTTSPLPFNAPLDLLRIEDLNFLGTLTVNSGRVELRRVAAKKLTILPIEGEEPVIDAVDCLFDTIEVKDAPVTSPPVETTGLVRLEHCTVLSSLRCHRLEASDCLLAGSIELTGDDPSGCVRYSRLPADLDPGVDARLVKVAATRDAPVFHDFAYCDGGSVTAPAPFGSPGCAALHPATPDSICFGAEDGTEMGAHHHLGYCVERAAVLDKVNEFLPVGVEAVLVPDARLLTPPPAEV